MPKLPPLFGAAFACLLISPSGAAEPTAEQLDKIPDERLVGDFRRATSQRVRAHLFGRIIDEMAGGAREVKPALEAMVAAAQADYLKGLKAELPSAYRKHLASLSEAQAYEVQRVRRKWTPHIRTAAFGAKFETEFLDAALAAADTVLPPLDGILVGDLAAWRAELIEYSEYLETCLAEIGFGDAPDPTEGKRSPTGHPYPKLDRPMTARENFDYLEKSLVMSLTIAPRGAGPLLAANAKNARELDYKENEFVMKAQIVRMITGSIGWYADPLTCACARDHSNDRKEGRASGHSSTVPGKAGMGDRARYWGTSARSEGAGGGKTGFGYLRGLSYGGGHTGPLYCMKRNVVGIGMRGGVGTSMYRTDKKWIHPCAVTEDELFMPPGLTREDCNSSNLRSIFSRLKTGDYGGAHELAAKAEEKDPLNAMVLRFMKAAIEVEFDWYLSGVGRIAKTGDYYFAGRLADEGKAKFRGLPEHEAKLASRAGGPHERANGKRYHSIIGNVDKLRSFAKRNPTSVYANAALHSVNEGGKPRPGLSYFYDQDITILEYGYPKR